FTAPQGPVSVTIFHLINTVGTLTIDDYGLQEVLPDSGPNRIANPSLETAATSGDPQGWFRGRWGTNTAVFTYPVAGLEGARAARVALTSRTSGDAKWYFADVPITPGSSWRFTDRFVANIPSTITARFALGNGQFLYEDLMRHTAAAGPQGTDVTFTAPQGTVSVTIFHLINTVGTLTIDDYGLVAASGGDPTEGIVTLTFDDGWKSIYENAIPMLRGAGIKSTQYIATGYLGFPAYITPTEVIAMQNEGHEIGAHSRTHRDLTTVSLAEATEEIAGSRDDLISIGVHSVKTFAYPFGAYNDGLKQILRNEGFVAARSTDNGANIPTMLDAFALKRHRADNSVTAAQIKTWIDEAREEKTWLILALHRIDNDGSAYSTPPAMLQEIIDHLQTTNTRTATVKEGLELFRSN
ncbi:MAG: polysaccharide deacetylase family protein, partial [bacterium]|nr:polysaccharide deacetylase family protein [bacterium]